VGSQIDSRAAVQPTGASRCVDVDDEDEDEDDDDDATDAGVAVVIIGDGETSIRSHVHRFRIVRKREHFSPLENERRDVEGRREGKTRVAEEM